jgi:hypothetical protein
MCSLNNCALALRVVCSLIRSAGRVPSLSRMWKKCRFIVTGSCAGLCKKPHREMSEVAAESKASNVATLAATSAFMYDGGADVLPEPGRRAGRLPPLGSSAAQSLMTSAYRESRCVPRKQRTHNARAYRHRWDRVSK